MIIKKSKLNRKTLTLKKMTSHAGWRVSTGFKVFALHVSYRIWILETTEPPSTSRCDSIPLPPHPLAPLKE